MAVVITVAQQKGGSGKTMLAANLAAWWGADKRVAVLDIDPQGSLAQWHRLRAGTGAVAITLSDVSGWRLAGELERLRREHELVLIDTPPVIDGDARRAIRAATLVVVPVQPSAPDLWAAEGTLKIAHEEKRPASFVLNRVASAGRQRAATEAALQASGRHVIPVALGNRSAFSQAFARGLGVTEAAPRTAAAAELQALAASLLEAAAVPSRATR